MFSNVLDFVLLFLYVPVWIIVFLLFSDFSNLFDFVLLFFYISGFDNCFPTFHALSNCFPTFPACDNCFSTCVIGEIRGACAETVFSGLCGNPGGLCGNLGGLCGNLKC